MHPLIYWCMNAASQDSRFRPTPKTHKRSRWSRLSIQTDPDLSRPIWRPRSRPMFQTLCFWARWHVTARRTWCGPHSKWRIHANLDTCVTVSWLLFCGQRNGLRRYILYTYKCTPMISVLFLLLRIDCDVAACTHVHTHDKQHVFTAHVISCRPARNIANVECIGHSPFFAHYRKAECNQLGCVPKDSFYLNTHCHWWVFHILDLA